MNHVKCGLALWYPLIKDASSCNAWFNIKVMYALEFRGIHFIIEIIWAVVAFVNNH